ncbi:MULTISPECIES: Arc family DNA-binding protein [unclassified Bartonella]|uniref:Arc family DNA-binding protein n=1 Tax=unclassified Bartonella TaxID=2645622 RepID=UPI0035CF85C9
MKTIQYKINMPHTLKEWLFNRATENDRSLSSEIINILKKEKALEHKSAKTLSNALHLTNPKEVNYNE